MIKGGQFDQHRRLRLVQVGVVLMLGLLAVSEPGIEDGSSVHEVIELLGFLLLLAGVGGRLWSILYIGGRKNDQLVAIGPFSMTRNPLYFFSTVAAVGMGLVFGSIIVAGILGFVAYLVFRSTGKGEADHLLRIFGPAYRAYADATPSFWPNPRLYIDKPEWLFSPPALRSTFLDGLWFLAIFPGLELLEFMHADRTLPVLLRLY